MQPLNVSSPSDDPAAVVTLPRPAINLALRVLQLLSGAQYVVTLQVIRVDGVLYLINGDALERLG